MKVSINLLSVELVDFEISNNTNHPEVISDVRPTISNGFSDNQLFVEITLNSKCYNGEKVCSITSSSRFDIGSPDTNLSNIMTSDEVVDIIAQLAVMASSHLMGMFRVKSINTVFYDSVIPARSSYEFYQELRANIAN